jgi:3-deoxy-manno-octulosonate cytidylyltransferase (CMP-KDO synthetase)
MSKFKVVGVIPVRFASSRFEGKALVEILGKTMVERVYTQSKKSKLLEDLFVATDDLRIKKEVEKFKGKVIMTSPDCPTGTDRVCEAIKDIETEIVVNIQGDLPFIEPEMIDSAIEPLLKDSKIEFSTIMHEINDEESIRNPNVVKVVVDNSGFALYFSRSPIPYPRRRENSKFYEHIGVYVYRKEFLLKFSKLPSTKLELTEGLEQLRAMENGYRIKVVEVKCPTYAGIGIDTPEDLKKVLSLLEKNNFYKKNN